MKKFLYLAFLLIAFACSSKKDEDPLILPPNFAEMPDLENPEKPSVEKKDEDVARLKDLLLKSAD